MSILLMLLAGQQALLTPPPAPSVADPVAPACQTPKAQQVDMKARGRVHPLGQEPPAKAFFTVVRTVDGCQKPVLVSEQLRGSPRR